ncbi:hypothetical protein GLAREA_06904 [Glarea lozoyensis ATCC 20868]|uniref:Uncharacterized protein n=2 Tax=Glarea lozoyensis TaxID=101852 RepID=S3DP70_GLAL2|nr:uncharacterized protein GLAREA_06904 [Glarea lozoyensis ATCC 20868]EHK99554.1 hypothetical protein M7I_4565 [Glarea lozoyensis 74030]EPE33891.1 hypothetical protein GLAREA_06904 [Glarea lozoyensis ATCC 20868]
MAQPNGLQKHLPGVKNVGNINGEIKQVNPAPGLGNEEGWDEAQLEKGMALLKEMHIQLRNLRTCIPRMIEPLTTIATSPESLFRDFSESTKTANKEVMDFKTLMSDEETKKVFEQARKSRNANPDNIKPWRAIDHPDWLQRDV